MDKDKRKNKVFGYNCDAEYFLVLNRRDILRFFIV